MNAFAHGVDAARPAAVRAAQDLQPFDLLLTGGTVVDLATCELREADVGITGGLIASVHPRDSRRDAAETHDLSGLFLTAGFIDSHLHFESSFMAPVDYATAVLPHGTTTTVWDPHELANVLGVPGVRWAVEQSRGLPLRVLVAAPSCVPSAPGLELAGADIGPAEMAEMLSWPEVAGVAEVMDMAGVLNARPEMAGIVRAGLESGKNVNGHARDLIGATLQAYAASGVSSDHEIMGAEDFLAKLRAGMTVELRGSHDPVLPEIVAALTALPMLPPNLCLCTDDIFPDELMEKGGLRDVMVRLIARGLPPIHALRLASFQGAIRLKRDDIGLVAPGRRAEIAVLSDLESVKVVRTYAAGKLVAKDGAMVAPLPRNLNAGPLRNTVKIPPQPVDTFTLKPKGIRNGTARLPVVGGVRVVEWREATVTVRDGVAEVPPGHVLIAILHRHGRRDPSPMVCLADGWGVPRGALATTISHDNHNLLVMGRDPADLAAAANALIESGGGMAVAAGGRVTALLPLPLAGLLAETPPAETAAAFARLRAAADAAVDWQLPHRVFRSITGVSLACNPGPHPTDLGISDGGTGVLRDPAEPLAA